MQYFIESSQCEVTFTFIYEKWKLRKAKYSNVTQLVHDGTGPSNKGWAAWELATQERRESKAFLFQWLESHYSPKHWSLILNFIFFGSEVSRHQTSRESRDKGKMRLWKGRHSKGIRIPGS